MAGFSGVTCAFNPSAAIATSGGSTLLTPRSGVRPNMRGCLFSHFDGAQVQGSSYIWNVSWDPWAKIARKLPVLGLDYNQSNVSPWGDDQQMTDMLAGYNYLKNTVGAVDSNNKINLIGVSMGGLNSLVYALHNPGKVNAILIGSPALSLQSMYATQVNLGGQINTAYSVANAAALISTNDPTWASGDSGANGGTTGASIAANRDPYWIAVTNAAAGHFAGIPIVILQGGIKAAGLATTGGTGTFTIPSVPANVAAGMYLTYPGMGLASTAAYPVLSVSAGTATVLAGSAHSCTAVTSTTITSIGAGWTTNAKVGQTVFYAGSQAVVTSNTAWVLTMSGGWTPSTPGSAGGVLALGDGTLGSTTFSSGAWFSNDATTWPVWADGFAAAVNAAGGNVTMIYDPLAIHAAYSDAANDAAIAAFLAVA